eukprot:CAMPEP_0202979128 /NCGR_PEP_ID=MMETSP1396-20130829/85362_1 /ASSEMBLY_ACC=CAM_ASM_000872 /TAXON_ID= /ORGANISM="Pseudokeronopsis sp., Strain Brazil" /LENGTH=64 /DNA_ID=CAMNT_0049718411 /DNA_START=2034 /DNA_END=2225 /DNA_ORIENTATION=+
MTTNQLALHLRRPHLSQHSTHVLPLLIVIHVEGIGVGFVEGVLGDEDVRVLHDEVVAWTNVELH